MEIRKNKIVKAIDQMPIVFGFPVTQAAFFAGALVLCFFIMTKNVLLGFLITFICCTLLYFYIKGFLNEKKIFYIKYRYLAFREDIKINNNK